MFVIITHFPVCLLVEGSIDFRHIGLHADDLHGGRAESIMIMVCFCVWKMRSAGDAKFNRTYFLCEGNPLANGSTSLQVMKLSP